MSVGQRLRHFVRRRLWASRDGAVWSGPFAGTSITNESVLCMLIGTYELEIHPWFERIVAAQPDRICIVGASDGYEAAGLLRRLPAARAVAWEADDARRAAMHAMLERNGVTSRARTAGFCEPAHLDAALTGATRAVVLIDVDGGEEALTDLTAIPSLARATLLVETHDIFVPGIHRVVCHRLRATHTIEEVTARNRTAADLPAGAFPILRHLIPGALGRALDERRPGPQQWILATPRIAG